MGCYSIAKYLLVVINLIFFVVSLILVGLAVWMLTDPTFYISLAQDENNYTISLYIFLIAGFLLLLASFFGCCGSLKESHCMLVSFFCVMLVIIVAEISAGIWAYSNSESLEAVVRRTVKNTVHEEYYQNEQRKSTFDAIQKGLQCCGSDHPSDWNGSKNIIIGATVDERHFSIPKSCCKDNVADEVCTKATSRLNIGGDIDFNVIYGEGCVNKVVGAINDSLSEIFLIGGTILLVQFLALVFALGLAFTTSKSSRYKH